MVNCAQIVDVVAVERAVLGILATNLKSQEQYDIVIDNVENASEKQGISLGEKEENKIIKINKSFVNQMLITSLSLKKKATQFENEEKKNLFGEEIGKNERESLTFGK